MIWWVLGECGAGIYDLDGFGGNLRHMHDLVGIGDIWSRYV